MAIDESIWGVSETWVNCLNSLCKTSEKTGYQLIDDTIPMNEPFDNSMCWCGVAQNLHKFYLAHSAITNNADFSPLVFKPLYNVTDVVNVPFLLGLGGNYFEFTFDFHNIWGRWADISSLSDGNMNLYLTGQCKPIFNIQLNKLIFIPTVTAFANNDPSNTTSESFSLSDWINTGHTTHPYLAQLFITPYFNSGTDVNPNWQPCYDSYDHYEYFCPNLETSDYIQNLPDSNFKIRYDFTNQANRKLTTLLMGCQQPYIGTYGTHRVVVDDDTSHYVSDSDHVRYCREYSAGLLDDIRTQIAFLGVFFIGDYIESLNDITLTHPSVYCGIIDDGGLTHGEYSHGDDNADRQQFEWDNSGDSEYDPDNPPRVDPNAYDGVMNINIMSDIETVTNRYNLSALSYSQLSNKLWEIMADIPADTSPTDWALDVFLTTNPIDNIVSLKYFPLVDDPGYGTAVNVHLGSYDTNISAFKAKTVVEHNCGYKMIFPKYNDWRDYETQIMLYLPFCGTISIDPKIYMGRNMYVDYVIDIITGNCSACVYTFADNGNKMIVEIANGNCAIDLPVTGIEQVTLQGQMYNATEQMKQLRVNNDIAELGMATKLIGAMGGNPLNVADSVLSSANRMMNNITAENIAEYEIQHMQVPVKMIGTTGSVTGLCMELYPTLIYMRPTTAKGFSIKDYGHTIGFADCSPCVISTRSGYAEFTNVDLSGITATVSEKKMIQAALASGVYL